MEEKSKNPKRVEAGKKLAENNKKLKEFYSKNSKTNYNYIYPVIGIVSGIGIFIYFYKNSTPTPITSVTPITPITSVTSIKSKSKHILYE